jgi:RimJ/RimL family protein N-acetyltransferase
MAYIATNGTIETDRLVLRKPAPEDAELLIALFADPEVMRLYGSGRTFDRARMTEALAEVERHYRDHGYGAQVMVLKETGEVIGLTGLQRGPISPGVQLGFVLAKNAWGNGYAFESGIALLDYGFSKLSLDRIEAITPASNVWAVAVIRKLGMPYEGTTLQDATEYMRFAAINPITKGRSST